MWRCQTDQEADKSSRKQHSLVPAEPGKVQTDPLPKIPPEATAKNRKKEIIPLSEYIKAQLLLCVLYEIIEINKEAVQILFEKK